MVTQKDPESPRPVGHMLLAGNQVAIQVPVPYQSTMETAVIQPRPMYQYATSDQGAFSSDLTEKVKADQAAAAKKVTG